MSEKFTDNESTVFKNINFIRNIHNYGIMSTGKWLAHSNQVDCIKNGLFNKMNPIDVQIAPTSICKYNCPMCSYGEHKKDIEKNIVEGLSKEKEYFMSFNDMVNCIDQIKDIGAKSITFTGGGEPLLNENTIQGLIYAKSVGLHVGLFTNGHELTNKKAKQIANISLSFVRISFNAGTPESYSVVHGTKTSSLKKVLYNIRSLAQAKKELTEKNKSKYFQLGIGVLISPLIMDDFMNIATVIKNIAIGYPNMINNIAFRPSVRYIHGCQFTDATQKSLNYIANNPRIKCYLQSYENFLYKKKQFPETLFSKAVEIITNEVKPFMEKGVGRVNVIIPTGRVTGVSHNIKPFSKCLAHPLSLFIGHDSTVYHCVELALDTNTSYGNLKEHSFRIILKSKRRKEVMNWINNNIENYCPPVCKLYEYNCIFNEINDNYYNGYHNQINTDIEFERNRFLKEDIPELGESIFFL